MTRAAPARLLGFADRGHLAPGGARRCRDLPARRRSRRRRSAPRRGSARTANASCATASSRITASAARCASRPSRTPRWRAASATITTARYGLDADLLSVPESALCRASRSRRSHVRADVNGVAIDDTFAEAFDMRATALVHHRRQRANGRCRRPSAMTGFATSVIACGCEAGIDRELSPQRDAGRAPRRARVVVRGLDHGIAEAVAEPRRPMRADQPRLGLLRRPGRGRGEAEARRGDPLFRRRLADRQRRSASAATGACR